MNRPSPFRGPDLIRVIREISGEGVLEEITSTIKSMSREEGLTPRRKARQGKDRGETADRDTSNYLIWPSEFPSRLFAKFAVELLLCAL